MGRLRGAASRRGRCELMRVCALSGRWLPLRARGLLVALDVGMDDFEREGRLTALTIPDSVATPAPLITIRARAPPLAPLLATTLASLLAPLSAGCDAAGEVNSCDGGVRHDCIGKRHEANLSYCGIVKVKAA